MACSGDPQALAVAPAWAAAVWTCGPHPPLPLMCPGLAVGLDPQGYGNPDFCWLSLHDSLIWSFAGPIGAVITVSGRALQKPPSSATLGPGAHWLGGCLGLARWAGRAAVYSPQPLGCSGAQFSGQLVPGYISCPPGGHCVHPAIVSPHRLAEAWPQGSLSLRPGLRPLVQPHLPKTGEDPQGCGVEVTRTGARAGLTVVLLPRSTPSSLPCLQRFPAKESTIITKGRGSCKWG